MTNKHYYNILIKKHYYNMTRKSWPKKNDKKKGYYTYCIKGSACVGGKVETFWYLHCHLGHALQKKKKNGSKTKTSFTFSLFFSAGGFPFHFQSMPLPCLSFPLSVDPRCSPNAFGATFRLHNLLPLHHRYRMLTHGGPIQNGLRPLLLWALLLPFSITSPPHPIPTTIPLSLVLLLRRCLENYPFLKVLTTCFSEACIYI